MSYEGYEQWLCANGHYRAFDCYSTPEDDAECDACGEAFVWRNSVDETNGDGDQYRVELEIKEPAGICECSCGNRHVVKEATYKIPSPECLERGICDD